MGHGHLRTLLSEPLLRTAEERLRTQGDEATPGVPDSVGRAVDYPGFSSLTGTVTVGAVLRGPLSRGCGLELE
jgi:hypothetical protein